MPRFGKNTVRTKGYVETAQGQVHYWREGAGAPVLLVHQTPRSSRMYSLLGPLLAHRHTVLAIDTLGAGASAPLPAGSQIEDVAGVAVAVLDALGFDRTHVFGIHSGAAIAAEIAAGSPQRVDRLMLYGLLAIEDSEREAALSTRMDDSSKFTPASDGSYLMRMWAWAHHQVARQAWTNGAPPQMKLSPEASQYIERCLLDLAQARDAMDIMHRAVFNYAWKARLPLIEAKALLIEGDGAFESPLARRTDRLLGLIDGSADATIPGADANVAEWRAQDLAKVILDFLSA